MISVWGSGGKKLGLMLKEGYLEIEEVEFRF